MATLITKNSSTASAVPGTGDLVQGELAVNVADKRLFTKNAGGSVVEVGTNPSSLVVTGDVGIGTSSPAYKLDVQGASGVGIRIFETSTGNNNRLQITQSGIDSIYNNTFSTGDGAHAWQIGGSELMRLTRAGDFLVGTTTTPSSSNAGFVVAKDGNGTYLRNACTITTTRTHFEFVNGNGTVGTISTNASATAYNTSSDRRLKENIAPAADAGPVIDAIEVIQHDWKVGGHTRFGVIAQDLNAVAPEAVSAGDDGDEIEKAWGVDYSKLVPMLIKEIQSLRARVAALEQV